MPFTPLDISTAQAVNPTNLGAPATNNGMELQDIRTEVTANLLNRADVAPGGDTTRLDRWINWGYLNICGMVDLQELWGSFALSTVKSQPFYALERSVSWIKRVSIEDAVDFQFSGGHELAMIDIATYRTLPDSSELDITPVFPRSWLRFSRMLVLWPNPDAVYSLSVDVRVRPLPLTNPQDCPLLPEEFHEAVVLAATERAWKAFQNPQKAALAGNDKLAVLRPLLNTDAEERDAMHATMAPAQSGASFYKGMI